MEVIEKVKKLLLLAMTLNYDPILYEEENIDA